MPRRMIPGRSLNGNGQPACLSSRRFELTKPAGPADPGDAYESAKFGSGACSLMIAHAVWKFATSKRTAQLMR